MEISSAKEFKSKVLNSETPVMVMFYADWCGYCERMKGDYSRAGSATKGMLKFAAVNSSATKDNQGLAATYKVQGFPMLKVFEKGKKSPVDFTGDRENWKQMKDFMMQKMKHKNVLKVSAAVKLKNELTGDQFFGHKKALKVLLISSKSEIPKLWMGIANEFTSKAAVGILAKRRSKAHGEFVEKMYGAPLADEDMPKIVAYFADGTKAVYPEEKTPFDEVKLWVTQQVETSREVVKDIKAGTKTNVWADLPPPS